MSTAQQFGDYVAWVRGHFIDVDGVFGAQCWDQWAHFAIHFVGVPAHKTYTNHGGWGPHPGYACNVYHHAENSGLSEWFEILPATAEPQAGDVAFWEFGSVFYPWSHVANVLSVTPNGMLRCLTQNPTEVRIVDLIRNGIIGYLRPRKMNIGDLDDSKTPKHKTPEPQEEEIMAVYMRAVQNSSETEAGNPGSSRVWAGANRVLQTIDEKTGKALDSATYSEVWERSENGSIRRLFAGEWEAIVAAFGAAGRKVPVAEVSGNVIERIYMTVRAKPRKAVNA